MVEQIPVKDKVRGPNPLAGAVKKTTTLSLKHYAKMSGDKKVRLGMEWSHLVREVYKVGKIQTQKNGRRSKTTS